MNATLALGAGSIALFLATRTDWLSVQRYLMGTMLFAVRMALETRRA